MFFFFFTHYAKIQWCLISFLLNTGVCGEKQEFITLHTSFSAEGQKGNGITHTHTHTGLIMCIFDLGM